MGCYGGGEMEALVMRMVLIPGGTRRETELELRRGTDLTPIANGFKVCRFISSKLILTIPPYLLIISRDMHRRESNYSSQ